MYSNAYRYVPISRLGAPQVSASVALRFLLRAAAEQHVIFTVHSFYSAANSAMHYFIYAVLAPFATLGRLNRVAALTCRRIYRVSHCSSGFALSQLSFRNTEPSGGLMLHARRFINSASCCFIVAPSFATVNNVIFVCVCVSFVNALLR